MKKLIKAMFLPENHHQEAFLDYHNLSQHNMTVEEVINEFDKLHMRCDVVEEEEQSYMDVYHLALKVEKHIKAKSKSSTSRFTSCFTLPARTASPIAPKTTPKSPPPQPRCRGIKIDPAKVEVIISWPTPSTIHDIRSLHGLASFYHRFIRNFSSIIVPLTECMKGGRFTWTRKATKAFDILKAKVNESHILALPNFDEVFQVECDAFGVGIGGVLSQNQRQIAFSSEKLNDARCKYSTYDKEFYAIVRSLDMW
nr:putative mitochondrial protein [Tanacetum cinerariifolium]